MNNEFSPQRIDEHVETVSVLIQPPIDIKDDRIHLQEFFNRASEQQPALYDSLSQEPGAFQIRKWLPLGRVGRLQVRTFALTPQGPVLSFPRKLWISPDEFQWSGSLNEHIVTTVSVFLDCHPGRAVLRLAKRHELVFRTDANGAAHLQHRFATGAPSDAQDVGVRWTKSDDRYDCRVTLDAVTRRKVVQQTVAGIPVQQEAPEPVFGIRLIVEVSSRQAQKALTKESWKIILDHADSFYNEVVGDLRRTQGDATA